MNHRCCLTQVLLIVCVAHLAGQTDSSGTSGVLLVSRQTKEASDTLTRFNDSTSLSLSRLTVTGVVAGGSLTAVHFFQQKAWWLGEKRPFWIRVDNSYALNIDKLGHMYGTYLLSRVFGYGLEWSDVKKSQSVLYGSALGLGFELLLECEDGFRKAYGFDPLDACGDLAGALIPIAQESFPILRNFSLKYSYWPSQLYLDELRDGRSNRIFIDDYEGMTLWLAMDPHFLMTESQRELIPRWLGISFGIAARNLDFNGGGDAVYYFTLDYNLSQIETNSGFLKSLFTAIDFIHLPAPGVRLSNGILTFGLFFR